MHKTETPPNATASAGVDSVAWRRGQGCLGGLAPRCLRAGVYVQDLLSVASQDEGVRKAVVDDHAHGVLDAPDAFRSHVARDPAFDVVHRDGWARDVDGDDVGMAGRKLPPVFLGSFFEGSEDLFLELFGEPSILKVRHRADAPQIHVIPLELARTQDLLGGASENLNSK